MKQTYYRIEMYIRWQFLFGISLWKHYNGYKCSVIRLELPFVSFVIDISREVDEFFKFNITL